MLRRTLIRLPIAVTALSGCTHAHRQDEVFSWFLRSVLVDAQKAPSDADPALRSIRLVVESQVSAAATFFDLEDLAGQIKLMPTVESSAIADLLLHRTSASRVRLSASLLPQAVTVDYVSPQVQRTIFSDDRGLGEAWQMFYKTYPGSGGLLAFSPVGFNLAGSQAVFAYAVRSGGLRGSGHVVLMRRVLSGWVTEDSQRLWSS
ncbi:MAG: hypothetical protein JF607_27300 [Burkholderiales bacterium]|jgi:hypothetical protein|nr:hypothetical protein [Burkholderiales bacterium]